MREKDFIFLIKMEDFVVIAKKETYAQWLRRYQTDDIVSIGIKRDFDPSTHIPEYIYLHPSSRFGYSDFSIVETKIEHFHQWLRTETEKEEKYFCILS